MFFRKKKEHPAKKIDKLITSLIIGGAVAGAMGLSQTEKGKKVTKKVKKAGFFKKGYSLFGKALAKTVGLVEKKNNKGN